MAPRFFHHTQNPELDLGVVGQTGPDEWNEDLDHLMTGPALLGRDIADEGVIKEIALGSGLEFNGAELRVDADVIATKAYADGLIAAADAMIFKGVIDASANPDYPAADKGWTYRISVAGKIGGASGPNVEVGDLLLSLADGTASGNHATVGTSWSIAQTNIDGAVVGPASVTDDLPAIFDGTTGKLIKQKTYAAFKTLLALVKGDVGLGSVTDDAQVKAADLASQAEAEAGSNNAKWTTPLRVAQAIAALGGGGGGVESGTRQPFNQTAAPTGYTKETGAAYNDALPWLVTGTIATGGSVAFSTFFGRTATDAFTLTTPNDIPAHAHTLTTLGNAGPLTPPLPVRASRAIGGTTASTFGGITVNDTGSGGGHAHNLDCRVKFVGFTIAVKD